MTVKVHSTEDVSISQQAVLLLAMIINNTVGTAIIVVLNGAFNILMFILY